MSNEKLYIKVKAFPEAKKERVIETANDEFEIYVREPALKGMANRAITVALSKYLQIPVKQIKLIKGGKTRNKLFEVDRNDIK